MLRKSSLPFLALCLMVFLAAASALRSSAQSPTVTNVFSFTAPLGSYPAGPLVQGSDGYYYGTTENGGLAGGFGTIFRMDSAANITVLHHFANSDGAYPMAGLVQGSDGYFYGATSQGGANNTGTIFKIAPDGTFVSLYSFSAVTGWNGVNSDGDGPNGGLIQASDGAYYGTTQYGGTSGNGAVFRITSAGAFTPLHSFMGAASDGAYPWAGLVQASDGAFYGTTYDGGANYAGAIFRMTSDGTVTTIHSFTGADGEYPRSTLLQGSDGRLYGTTVTGSGNAGYGTVFAITTGGVLTTLHTFATDGATGGAFPEAGLVKASDGYMYGTASQGGAYYFGMVYRINTSGGYAPVYSFRGWDGNGPSASLLQGSDGNLYTTVITTGGYGSGNPGIALSITTGGALASYHIFEYPDGFQPYAGVIQANDGNLYGTTLQGGQYGMGSVFSLATDGTFTSRYSFSEWDGDWPLASLMQASDGNIYGTNAYGGPNGDYGTIFKLNASGFSANYHAFSGLDGAGPRAALIQASDGNLYGTTVGGGVANSGAVYQMTAGGTVNPVYSFDTTTWNGTTYVNTFGAGPHGIVQANDGNLYGTTSYGGAYGDGTAYRLTLGGTLTLLYTFTGGADGFGGGNLIQASDGNLYGLAGNSLFRMTLDGTLTTLYTFTGGADGFSPNDLFQASDGNLYGTTQYGGANYLGTIFRLTLGGTFTTIYAFSGLDGQYPVGALIAGSDGTLYGVTQNGGEGGGGVVYRLTGWSQAPGITSLSPDSANACGPAFTLTVNGSNFVSGAVVSWNGTAQTTTFVSSTQLTAAVPAAAIATPGAASVTVTQNGQTSNTAIFTITNPVPVLKSISPASKDAGGPAFTLIAKGACFLNGSTLTWNGTALTTTFVSATQLKAGVPAALTASPGTAKVSVSTPSPGGGASVAKPFMILVTTLKLTSASLTRNSTTGVYTAKVSLKNIGYLTAPSVKVSKASLGAAATSTALPVSIGNLAAGATGTASLVFPKSAGAPGTVVMLKVSGTFTGGTFSGSLNVTLP